jgi:hypothetical protein
MRCSYVTHTASSLFFLAEMLAAAPAGTPAESTAGAFLRGPAGALAVKWLTLQCPAHVVALPELCRLGACVACACAAAGMRQGVAAAAAAAASLSVQAGPPSSVWLVCGADTAPCLDSRACKGGLDACADWRAAAQAGLATSRTLTLPLSAGPVTVGFLTLHFGLFAAAADGDAGDMNGAGAAARVALLELCDAVAAAVFVRRALAVSRDAFSAGMHAAGVPLEARMLRVPSLTQLRRSSSWCSLAASESRASSSGTLAEDAAALAALDATADADAAALSSWSLDPWTLSDEEAQRLLLAMLHQQGLLRAFGLSPVAAAVFIADVAAHYTESNPFRASRGACARVLRCCCAQPDARASRAARPSLACPRPQTTSGTRSP